MLLDISVVQLSFVISLPKTLPNLIRTGTNAGICVLCELWMNLQRKDHAQIQTFENKTVSSLHTNLGINSDHTFTKSEL
jgi:hypothetical protein|tara:strand:+ start:390 stop:626 length:237 start_codon:yes stop_codon:yes gene_type:complete